MTSVVVTGTGLITAAGPGHDALEQALARGECSVRARPDGMRCSEVAREQLFWPASVEWQATREYAGLASQLAVTACHQAYSQALLEAAAFDLERGATVVVAGDDWTEQETFDRAIASAASLRDEARALFSDLDDQFLLRTFRWSVGFGVAALTGFQGPSVGVDTPSFGGLAGLLHAVDLIESGESDAVMLVAVDTVPRLDVAVALEQLRQDTKLSFGQGAAALMLERSSTALQRRARPLARVVSCETALADAPPGSRLQEEVHGNGPISSAAPLGTLFNAGALVDLSRACQWLSREASAGRVQSARAVATETFGAHGVASATLVGIQPQPIVS